MSSYRLNEPAEASFLRRPNSESRIIDVAGETYRAVEFIEEDVELLRSYAIPAWFIPKLDENLKLARSFLIQEAFVASSYVFDIRDAVAQLSGFADRFLAIYNPKLLFMELMRLRQLCLRFDSLVKKIRLVTFHEVDGFLANCPRGSAVRYSSSSSHTSTGEIIVGFGDEVQILLDRLVGRRRQLEVDSIVGMPGIGKTTLAKRLYNDQSVVYHFHIRAWVSVSQVYKKTNILSSILNSILAQGGRDSFASTDDTEMGEKLYRCLKGQRYLIVIDDIWDIGVWNDIKMYFPNDSNKSRILITTRIEDVASSIQSNNAPHCLRFLSPEESWNLFTFKVFADKSCPPELMKIGKKIVAKCKGLPLAIVLMAGLLSKNHKTQEFWTHIADNIGLFVDSGDTEQIMDILASSYDHLPQHLKLCFVYLATCPEDYEIPVKQLMRNMDC